MKRAYIFGAGNVGRALAAGLRRAGVKATLRPARRGLPGRKIDAELLVLAVRDGDIAGVAERLTAGRSAPPQAAVHCAGSLDPEVLAPLRRRGVAVGQMHPLISIAGRNATLAGGWVHVAGDALAARRARALARALGMRPFTVAGLEPALYHAAAALLANGAVALVAAAREALVQAGCAPEQAASALAPLLDSVTRNVRHKGLPEALTGPVRRGNASAVAAHLTELGSRERRWATLYRALALSQLPMARELAEAGPEAFDAIESLARASRQRASRRSAKS